MEHELGGRKGRRRPLLVLAALAAAALVALAGTAGATNNQTLADASGDSGNAPDITTVAVSNDDAGTITFQVGVPNRSALGSQDFIAVGIDFDHNLATGSPAGLEYALFASSGGFLVAAWNGSTWGPGSAPTFSGSFAAGQLTFTVNRSDLGGTSAFEFGLFTSGDGGATTPENAPDLGYWSYEVSVAGETPPPPPAPPAPSAQALTVMGFPFVSTAKAGGLLTVHLVVFLDGNLPLEDGQVNCGAHIGAKVLRVQGKLGPLLGVLSCTWRVPKNTHGKRLSGTIGVTFENATVSSPFSAKIK